MPSNTLRSLKIQLKIAVHVTFANPLILSTADSETLEGMFLVNNSTNTQCRAPKPSAMDFY